jgi:hypothetical protein
VSGQFTVKPNPDADQLDYMVDVVVTYNTDDVDARNSSAICLMQENDKWGVGIYVSSVNAVQHFSYPPEDAARLA